MKLGTRNSERGVDEAAPAELSEPHDASSSPSHSGWTNVLRLILTGLVVLMSGIAAFKVLPETLTRLGRLAVDQHRKSVEHAPQPNRWEQWIVDMERMALTWLEPGDRVAVWTPLSPSPTAMHEGDRMRLAYLIAPRRLWLTEHTAPEEVDWVYSSRASGWTMGQTEWTGFEQVPTPRAHYLYRRIDGRAADRPPKTNPDEVTPDGGPGLVHQVTGTLAAMLAVWLAGWWMLMAWTPGKTVGPWLAPAILALVLGQLAVGLGMALATGLGLGASGLPTIAIGLAPALLVGAVGSIQRRRVHSFLDALSPMPDQSPRAPAGPGRRELWCIGAWGLLMFVAGSAAATCWHTNCLPGMGIWGHKAKVFYLAGGFPEGYFSDPGWNASKPGYPLLPGMLMQWGYVWNGAVADRAVGMWNALWLAALGTWLMLWLRSWRAPWVAVWGLLPLLLLSGQLLRHLFERYAEPLLFLQASVGLVLVAGALGRAAGSVHAPDRNQSHADQSRGTICATAYLGLGLVATTAWIKHEGVLLTLVCVLGLVLMRGSRKALMPAHIAVGTEDSASSDGVLSALRRARLGFCLGLAGALLLAGSWLLTVRGLGAEAGSYDWGRVLDVPRAETRDRLLAAWAEWREYAVDKGWKVYAVWWLVPGLLLWSLTGGRTSASDGATGMFGENHVAARSWLVVVVTGYALGLGCVTVFSTQPFPWVMTSTLTRGMMLTTLLLASAGLAALAPAKPKHRACTCA